MSDQQEGVAVIYARVSTEDQADLGTSLESQTEACVGLAEREGYESPEGLRLADSASGASVDRPQLERLRELVRTKAVDAVVYYAPDRLSRDAVDLVVLLREFRRSGVRVLSVHQPPADDPLGQAIQFLLGTFAEVERREIAERTMRGKLTIAKNGRLPQPSGRYSPYGLRWDKSSKRYAWLSETHRATVRWIMDLYQGRLSEDRGRASINTVTRALNSEHILATGGSIWHRSAVHRVLSHALLYAGTATWLGIEIPNALERPVLGAEEVKTIQDRLASNKEAAKGFGRRRWLSGRVFGECGHVFSLNEKRGARCRGNDPLLPEERRCGDRRLGLKTLEDTVLKTLMEVLVDPERIRIALIRQHAYNEVDRYRVLEQGDAIGRQLEEIDRRRRLLSVQHEAGVINDAELKARYATLGEERRRAAHALEELEALRGDSEVVPVSSWLDEAHVEAWTSVLLGLAGLGHAARERNADAMQTLDTLADDLGLRVVVRNDGGFGIQFSIPEQMRVPSEKGAGRFLVETDPMLSPTSSSWGQHRTVPVLVTFDPTRGASLVVGVPSRS